MIYKLIKFIIVLALSLFVLFVAPKYLAVEVTFHIIAVYLWFRILGSDREYYSKLIWLLTLLFSPYFGVICFILLGSTYKSIKLYREKTITDRMLSKYEGPHVTSDKEDEYVRIMKNLGKSSIYSNSNVELLQDGKEKFPYLINELKKAKDHIHIEYFIFKESEIGNEIMDVLIDKAQNGVEVRLLVDSVGCSISNGRIKEMRHAGIKFKKFSDIFFPLLSSKANFRNHRKIVVIDAKVAFVGGHNIGDEYNGTTDKYGYWRDTHLVVRGDAVHDFQITFAKDWYYETKENIFLLDEFKYLKNDHDIINENELIQVVNNGPDNKNISTKDIYFKMIANAKHQITIMTPYFIPDYDIVKALTTAAQNGVKIRLMVPGVPDKKMVYAVTRTHYDKLLGAGVEVYELDGSFVHSKILVIDDNLSTIGTVNMDFRSFNLNFEITAFVSSEEIAAQLLERFDKDVAISTRIEMATWMQRPIIGRYFANFVQIFSPLL